MLAQPRSTITLRRLVACRTGATDASIIAKQIGLGGEDALLDLPNFTAWSRLLYGGVPTSPIRLNLYHPPRARRVDARRLIETSRTRFGRPRAKVEDRIRQFVGS